MTRRLKFIGILLLMASVYWAGAALAQTIGQVQFPSGLDSFFQVVNNLPAVPLTRQANPADTTIFVSSTGGFPSSGWLAISNTKGVMTEVVFYSGKTSTSFTGCLRGQDGTLAQVHAASETASQRIIAANFNLPYQALIAVEGKLGTGASTPVNNGVLTGGAAGSSSWIVPGVSQVTTWLGFTPVNRGGDTMAGALVLAADPVAALGAATKQYVDARAGVISFNTRTGAVTLLQADVTGALGYTPQTQLNFAGQLVNSSGTISCPTCEDQSNKNIGNGYAGLTSAAKIPVSLGQEVWGVADLTDYTGSSGSGSTAIKATITSPNINDALTWNGTNWINQAGGGGGGSGYSTIGEEGTSLTQRSVLNFIGAPITAADNAGATRTDVTLSESPASASVVGVGRLISTGTGLSGGGDLSSDRTLSVVADSVNEQLQFLNNGGTLISTRHALQVLTGGALSWNLVDDSVSNRAELTPVLSTSPSSAATVVGTGRLVSTTSPLSGGGDLSSDRTLSIGGLSSLGTGNQLVGVLGAGGGWEYKTLSGTTNQVNVNFSSGSITLGLPQSIDTGSSPTWTGLNITGTANLVVGSSTAIAGTNAISLLFSSAANKPGFKYLSTGTGTGKLQFSNDGVSWTDLGSGGGGGITSLNGLTASSQSFGTGTSGTDFNISSASGTHTFNIPDASASSRGLVTIGTQTFAGGKTFSGDVTFESRILVAAGGADPTLIPGQSPPLLAGVNYNSTLADSTNERIGVVGSIHNSGTAPSIGVMGDATGDGAGSRVWGGNLYAYNNNATSFAQGLEIDVGNLVANTSGGNALAVAVVQNRAFAGNAIAISTITPGGTFANGINFTIGSGSAQPFASSASFIRSDALTAANGIDFTRASFTGSAFASIGFSVDPTGSVSSATRYILSAVETANATTTDLPVSHAFAIYSKGNRFVIAYNSSGTMHYLTAPINGSTGTATWTDSTTAP